MVHTAFTYGRALIVCLFLLETFKVKESSLHEILNASTVFLLSGAHVANSDRYICNSFYRLLFCHENTVCQQIIHSLFCCKKPTKA